MDADTYVAQALQTFDLYSYEMWIDDVIAVRGERLALCVRSLRLKEWDAVRSLAIVQFDEQVDLLERWVRFELDQLEEAIDELAQMYSAIEEA